MFRIIFLGICWLCLAGGGSSPARAQKSPPMKDLLSADLIPEILEPGSTLLRVKVVQVQLAPQPGSQPALETGKVNLQVLDKLRAGTVEIAETIEVPAHRIGDPVRRHKSNQDQWNNLPLEPGAEWVLACRPLKPPAVWQATAAIAVTGPGDANVTAVRRALEIEASAPERRKELLKGALEDPATLLRFYALEALSRGKTVPKTMGVSLIEQAIAGGRVPGEDRLELGRALTKIAFFNKGDHAGGTNAAALAGLAQGLLSETDILRRLEWARLISSCFAVEFAATPAANRATRADLLRKLPPGLAPRVNEALTALAGRGSPEEREMVQGLHAAWQEAMPGQ